MSYESKCYNCNGVGTVTVTCHLCGGEGEYNDNMCKPCNGQGEAPIRCGTCNGKGKI